MATNQWLRLSLIAKESREIAKVIVPMIANIPYKTIELKGHQNLVYLTSELSKLIDGVVFSENISLNECAQNNYEFLDTLKATLTQIFSLSEQQPYPIVETEKLEPIIQKIGNLLEELNSPPFLQHRKRTPEDGTVA